MVSTRTEDKKQVGTALYARPAGTVSKSMQSNKEVPEQIVAKIESCYVTGCTWRHLWKQDWIHRRVLNYIPALIGVPNSTCVTRFIIFDASYKAVNETLPHTSRHTVLHSQCGICTNDECYIILLKLDAVFQEFSCHSQLLSRTEQDSVSLIPTTIKNSLWWENMEGDIRTYLKHKNHRSITHIFTVK